MDVFTTILIMVICLIAEGFFSGSEIGVVSADTMKLRHAAAKGSRGARLALKMLETPEWLLSTTLVGTNIAVVTNTTMATALVMYLLGDEYSWVAVVVVAPLIWIFGEIVPKSIFQQRADTITPRAIYALRAASYLFFPILLVFSHITRLLTRIMGNPERSPFTLREEIIIMMHMSAEGGDIRDIEKDMIRRMFRFSETTVHQVMVPLIDVAGIEMKTPCGAAVRMATSQAHVRLPVYDERIDRIVGILHVLELLGLDPESTIGPHVRPARYVPGDKSIKNLLIEMRRDGDALAVVVDEFGGAEGIVAIEDIMEEVVEEIEDEYDSADRSPELRKLGDRDYIVSARIELDKLCEALGIELPESRHATLAGFLLEQLKDIPPRGNTTELSGVSFTIVSRTPRVIEDVRIRW